MTALLVVLGLWLTLGTVAAFVVPAPPIPGDAWFAESYRIVFFHMPWAWAGALAFIVAAVHAARYLATRNLRADALAWGAAEIGLVFTVLATVTGSIFSRSQWGAWWNWDPRQTSIFFVVLMYAAYLVLRQALPEDEALRAKLSAAYLLLAVAPMVWLVGIFPRMQKGSLHPSRAPLDGIHWQVIFLNFVGILVLFGVLQGFQAGIARIQAAARERWL